MNEGKKVAEKNQRKNIRTLQAGLGMQMLIIKGTKISYYDRSRTHKDDQDRNTTAC